MGGHVPPHLLRLADLPGAIGRPDSATLTASLFANFAPATVNVHGLLVPLLLYTTPLLAVHACEAWFDDGLVVPRLPVGVRYSIYAATGYLTLLFGNFGGAEFIYFQF